MDGESGAFGSSNNFYLANVWDVPYFDEKTLAFNLNNDQLIESVNYVKQLYDIAGGAQKVAGFHTSYGTWTESPTAMFPSGVEAMMVDGYWGPGELKISSPGREFAYTWIPVPTARKGRRIQSSGGNYAFIPSGVKQTANAFQLIEFLVGDSAARTIFDFTGWLGARISFLKKLTSADMAKYPGLDFFISSYTNNDELLAIPTDPIESYVSTQWNTAVQNVLYGKATAKDALQQVQQIVTNEMKQRFPNG